MTIQTEVLSFEEWQKMDDAIRVTLSIKGTFYSRFEESDYGIEAKSMIEGLDSGTKTLRIAHTMSGTERLVIISLCELDKATADAIGVFWDTDTATSTELVGYKFRQDVLTRLRSIIEHEKLHQKARIKAGRQLGRMGIAIDLEVNKKVRGDNAD